MIIVLTRFITEAETATKKWGVHVLKLWGWGPRLRIMRAVMLSLVGSGRDYYYAVVGEPRTKLVAV